MVSQAIGSSAERFLEVSRAVHEAMAARRPFFFAWLHADGTVRFAVYEAMPAMVAQAAQAFLGVAAADGHAVADLLPRPSDPTV